MFIFNVKVNGSKVFKIFLSCIIILFIIIIGIIIYRILSGANNSSKRKSCLPQSGISEIKPQNYTNVLKSVHDNIDNYIGKKIKFTGYIYRVYDLDKNQFILARNMIISSDSQYVVVGFLCNCENAQNYEDGTWVTITGTITKGDYHGDMPIIKIDTIKEVQKPTNNEYVYPPDDNYIPTSATF